MNTTVLNNNVNSLAVLTKGYLVEEVFSQEQAKRLGTLHAMLLGQDVN
jgi:hypothetical protein